MSAEKKAKETKAAERKEKKLKKQELAQQNKKARAEKTANKPPSKARAFFRRINTKRNRIIAIIVAVIVLLLIINGIVKARQEKMAAFNVTPEYQTVSVGDIELTVSGDGNLESGSSMTFLAETDLAIENVVVLEGQKVKAGDVIATLDAEGMQDILRTVEYDLNEMQATVDESDRVKETYYIKAPVDGRLKDIQLLEDGLVEDAMADVGYIALISTVEEMKIEITEEEYEALSKEPGLAVKCERHKYDEDVELRYIGGTPYVIIPTDMRTIGAEADIYSITATKSGNELASGIVELVAYEKLQGTYGEISYQDDFENYRVDKGEVLFHVDKYKYTLENAYYQLKDMRDEYNECLALTESLTLTAPYDGIVTSLALSDDATITQGSAIASFQSLESWKATIAVDELDIATIQVGQEAVVTIDALDYQEFPATVRGIASAGTASGGITTYNVLLDVQPADGFRISMTLTCEIVTESASGVLTVPQTAVRSYGDISYVLVAADRTLEERAKIRKAILKNDYETLMEYLTVDLSSDDTQMTMGSAPEGMDMESMPEGFDPENMPEDAALGQPRGGRSDGTIIALSNMVELLYGDIRIVETGLDDGSYVEIIDGLEEGDSILLPIASDSDADTNSISMFGMGGMAGGGGGSRPSGDGPPSGGGTPPQ